MIYLHKEFCQCEKSLLNMIISYEISCFQLHVLAILNSKREEVEFFHQINPKLLCFCIFNLNLQ